MLKELVNYANWLKKDFPELFEGSLTEGLHVKISLEDTNDKISFEYESKLYQKDEPIDEFFEELRKREVISKALGNNKGIIDKVIFSNNPYAIFFKLYFTSTEKKDKRLDKDGYERFINNKENRIIANFENVKKELFNKFVNMKLEKLFNASGAKNIISYYKKIEKEYPPEKEERKIFDAIDKFVKEELKNKILNDQNFISMFIKRGDSKIIFENKFFNKEIRVNFLVDFSLLEKAANRYFSKRIFNVDDFNTEKGENIYGLSNFFNKAAKEKKIFNLHKTAFYNANKLIPLNWASILNEFIRVRERLPNPLPIFIDRDELNEKVVKIFRKDNEKSYKEIISELSKEHKEDLNNYYLINFTKKTINDLDFVSSFEFYLDKVYSTKELLYLFNLKSETKIENIFNIEEILSKKFLFKVNRKNNNQYEVLRTNYFSKKIVSKGYEIPGLNNLYKYKKTLYDAIYKSRLYLITPSMIKEICLPIIFYEISHDETNEKGFSKYENRIKEKLLSYFLLNEIFDKEHKNTGGIKMGSKLPEYFKNMKELLDKEFDLNNSEQITFKSDEDFAFALGQVIRYLLELSESGNKNHSMFTPFLQKLNNYELFKDYFIKAFKSYAYRIKMNYRIFDRLMSNITSYDLNGKNLIDFEQIIISGYFADSVIKKKINEISKKNKNSNNNNSEEAKN